jgi:hypothetical protein
MTQRGKIMKRKEKVLKRRIEFNNAQAGYPEQKFIPKPNPKRNLRKRKVKAGKLVTFKDF